MFVKQRSAFGSFGDGESSSPTFGITMPWWVIAIAAGVWLVPQLYKAHRSTAKKKEE